MPHGDRYPDTSYKGIDSFTFKAPSDFIDKHSNWKKSTETGLVCQKDLLWELVGGLILQILINTFPVHFNIKNHF